MKFIPISKPSITQKEIDYVTDAVKSGWVSSFGKYLEEFEDVFAHFCNTGYALTVMNGTCALHLALAVYDIKEGDEVIVPDLTFIATANAVRYAGANVVIVDIERDTLCIDPDKIERAITKNTKAIIPVHLYGHPANMVEIMSIAKKHNIVVIEDAAEAHGAEVNGIKVGSIGDCGVFSFYGNKIITTGEGGMITTNDKDFYEKAIYLRDHAMSKSKRYWHTQIGYNYRMTNLQAALGVVQLERINEFLAKRKLVFELYKKYMSSSLNIRLNQTSQWAKNVYWMICIEIEGYNEIQRDALIIKLKEKGIDSRPYFYPVSDMPMYAKANTTDTPVTPVTHEIYCKGINLPTYFDITEDEIKYICQILMEILGNV
jgi:perosamine synthetase